MKSSAFAAVAAISLFAGSATAQMLSPPGRSLWGPRIQITPWVGFAPAASRLERWAVVGPGGAATSEYDVELASGGSAGLTLELHAIDRFALIAGGAFLTRGQTRETGRGQGGLVIEHEGSNFVMGKAALAMRLRESVSEIQMRSLSATIFAGPAFVREMPKDDAFAPAVLLQPLNHYGLNFGFDALFSLPYASLSFQAGIEDWLIWWNAAEFARRNDVIFAENGIETQSFMETAPSHNFMFRAGLSFRWR